MRTTLCALRYSDTLGRAPASRALVVALLLSAAILLIQPAFADCVRYEDYLHWVAGMETPGETPTSLEISGTYACMMAYETYAPRTGRLMMIDIEDPLHPVTVGSVELPCPVDHQAQSVKLSGHYAYVAQEQVFNVIDIGDPTNPLITGDVYTIWSRDVAVDEAFAYIVGEYGGMDVVDISDPADPHVVSNLPLPPLAYKIDVENGYAYVAQFGAALLVIDVSNPHSPALVATLPMDAQSVVVAGRYAYVGGQAWTFHVVDIIDPRHPTILGNVNLPGNAENVIFEDDHVFIADWRGGMCIVDVTDPWSPRLEGGVKVSCANDVAFSGDHAYVTDPNRGLEVVRLGNHQCVPSAGTAGLQGQISRVDVSGAYAYLAMGSLSILELADMSLVGNVSSPGGAQGLAVDAGHAYVASADSGLQVVHVADPKHPRVVGRAHTVGSARCVDVMGETAYVAVDRGNDRGALYVIDVGDPSHPSILASFSWTSDGSPLCVAVSGDHAYVGTIYGWPRHGKLLVVGVSDPFHLQLVGSVDTPTGACDVAITGHYAGVADTGLQMVEIADPQNPRIVGSIFTGSPQGVRIQGDTAYLVDREYGGLMDDLMVIDIGDPSMPRIVGNTPLMAYDWPVGVALADGFVVAATWHYVQIFPLECPMTEGVAQDERRVPGSLPGHDLKVCPNPTRDRAAVRTDLEVPGHVRVTIHDASGRQVRMLHDGLLGSGAHDLLWDGHDEVGRGVAPGVYLARVANGDASSARRGVMTARILVLR